MAACRGVKKRGIVLKKNETNEAATCLEHLLSLVSHLVLSSVLRRYVPNFPSFTDESIQIEAKSLILLPTSLLLADQTLLQTQILHHENNNGSRKGQAAWLWPARELQT